jgi:hypothetical protein
MRLLSSALVIAGLLGCNRKPVRDARAWFIESYDSGVITVQHEGYTYKATCDPSSSLYNLDNPMVPTRCDAAIGLVGHGVQPFEGQKRGADGRFVIMWNVGGLLTLQSVRGDEKTSWRREEFRISSVTKTPR